MLNVVPWEVPTVTSDFTFRYRCSFETVKIPAGRQVGSYRPLHKRMFLFVLRNTCASSKLKADNIFFSLVILRIRRVLLKSALLQAVKVSTS